MHFTYADLSLSGEPAVKLVIALIVHSCVQHGAVVLNTGFVCDSGLIASYQPVHYHSPQLHYWWRRYNCSQTKKDCSYHYLPTVILTIIFWYSITHSLFHSRLKTFLFC